MGERRAAHTGRSRGVPCVQVLERHLAAQFSLELLFRRVVLVGARR